MPAPRPLPFCACIMVYLAVGCGPAAAAPTSPPPRSPSGVHKLVLCTGALLLSVLAVAIVAVDQRLLRTLIAVRVVRYARGVQQTQAKRRGARATAYRVQQRMHCESELTYITG